MPYNEEDTINHHGGRGLSVTMPFFVHSPLPPQSYLEIRCPHCENVFRISDPNEIYELLMQMENRELRCSRCFMLLTDEDIASFYYNVNTALTQRKHGVNIKRVNTALTVNTKLKKVPPESAALLPHI